VKCDERLAERFESTRPRLQRIALRILGSPTESEDALQESWLRVARADTGSVDNLDGWLTTVVARVCLDALKRRKSRREELIPDDPRHDVAASGPGEHPEQEAVHADSVGTALRILIDELAPAERVAFVLHDMFDVPFDDIGAIVGRSSEAARQLASRARRRVRGASIDRDATTQRHDELVRAFFAASRAGNFLALLTLLDPGATLRADAVVAAMPGTQAYFGTGAPAERGAPFAAGAEAVANAFLGRARAARPAYLGEEPAAVWMHEGHKLVLFRFTIAGDRIATIELVGDPSTLEKVTVSL
jgi:RNA polymerase sigma factor (sigma-70 family)